MCPIYCIVTYTNRRVKEATRYRPESAKATSRVLDSASFAAHSEAGQLQAWLVGSYFDLESSVFALLSVELDELIPEVFGIIGCSDVGTITAVADGWC